MCCFCELVIRSVIRCELNYDVEDGDVSSVWI